MLKWFLIAVAIMLPTSLSFADISYSSIGAQHSENFDGLSSSGTGNTWTNDSTISGWFSNRTTYNASTGSSATGALYSYGNALVPSDRALGSLASGGTGTILTGIRFTNSTGTTLKQFTVTYDGEQWRNGGNTTPHSLTFDYLAGAGVNLGSAGYTGVSQLNFTGPIATASAGALDGNLVANRTSNITFTVTNITWLPGEQLVLRWTEIDHAGSDHGLAVDNFRFIANVPEPSSLTLIGLIGLNLVGCIRRRCF